MQDWKKTDQIAGVENDGSNRRLCLLRTNNDKKQHTVKCTAVITRIFVTCNFISP